MKAKSITKTKKKAKKNFLQGVFGLKASVNKKQAKKSIASSNKPIVARLSTFSETNKASVNPINLGPYRNTERILLIGEGDFTFARALCTALGGNNIVATSLDSREEVIEKYENVAIDSLAALQSANVKVLHGIDATVEQDLRQCMQEGDPFDVVSFNFPHPGGLHGTDIIPIMAKSLLSNFFKHVHNVLMHDSKNKRGRVFVTLRSSQFYDDWSMDEVAEENGLVILHKKAFQKELYPGYEPVRTIPGVVKVPNADEAFTHVYIPKSKSKDTAKGTGK